MILHRYDLALPFDELVDETRRAIDGWQWQRGAHGHALSLPSPEDLHPYARYAYQNYPSTGLLARLPAMRALFDSLRCDKVSFRLLRRAPGSAYGWHVDRWKGAGVVRFQVPILADPAAFLVLTDYESVDQLRGDTAAPLGADGFAGLAAANEGHVRKHHPQPGVLHYFDTTRVHTLVNPGPGERIALSFDLVANDWLLQRFPEIRAEIGEAPEPLPRPDGLRLGIAFAGAQLHPLRNALRRWVR